MRVILQAILLFVTLAAPLSAMEPEVHAVGVYEGNEKTNGRIHGPEAYILVDRSNAPVILSIGSYDPVRWYIQTAPGTRIETILLHGYKPDQSEVYLNDIRVSPTSFMTPDSLTKMQAKNFVNCWSHSKRKPGYRALPLSEVPIKPPQVLSLSMPFRILRKTASTGLLN